MRIRTQLMCIAVSGAASAGIVTGLSAWSSSRTQAAFTLAVEEMKAVRAQMDGDMMHDAIHSDMLRWVSAVDDDARREARASFLEHAERMRKDYEEVSRLSTLPESKVAILDAKAFVEEYIRAAERLLSAETEEDRESAHAAFTRSFEHGESALGVASDLLQQGAEACAERASTSAERARTSMLILAGVLITVVTGVAAWLSSRLSRRMSSSLAAVQHMGKGDLTHRVNDSGNDELGDFARAYNLAAEALKEVIRQVKESAGLVSGGAGEIAAAAEQMATGMSRQRDQASQASTAMEEMAGSVTEVAQRAGTAAESSHAAQAEADRGGDVVARTVVEIKGIADDVARSSEAMASLGKRSEQIGAIIEVINDIADQTNLLALNAAIEAARAGEHGRGFAVVADEVRKLAERTQQATEQVSTSIREIQEETRSAVERIDEGSARVARGVDLANSAGEALSSIVGSGKSVQALVESIAAAANEQAAAGDQMAKNISQILSVSAENTQGAEQSARAASELAAHAGRLQELVARFRI